MSTNKLPVSFWIIAVVALLWNLMGLGAFISEFMVDPESMAAAYTDEQMELIRSYPSWTKIFYGLATICGTLGCIGLIMRKKWAYIMFMLSLFGVIVQQAHSLLMTDALKVFGAGPALFFPAMILLIGVFLLLYTKKHIANGTLT